MIKIIDYSMGNIGSIVNMFKRIDVEVSRATTITDIRMASKLILPGVGAFDQGMENLRRMGIVEALNEEVLERRKPILGSPSWDFAWACSFFPGVVKKGSLRD
jgi:imidazole glycerol-phosphate synthase subunit HisH